MHKHRYVYIQAGLLYFQVVIPHVGKDTRALPNNIVHKVGIGYMQHIAKQYGT